jgi:hypothetical protein
MIVTLAQAGVQNSAYRFGCQYPNKFNGSSPIVTLFSSLARGKQQ